MDSIDDYAGDPAGARVLRASLRALAERYAGTPLGRQVDDVLAGRASMRDLADDPELATLAQEGMRRYAAEWAAKSPEERAALLAEGRATDAALRADHDQES